MRLSAINNFNPKPIIKNNDGEKTQPTFKGILDTNTGVGGADHSDPHCDVCWSTDYYYPFHDESDYEIKVMTSGYPIKNSGVTSYDFPDYYFDSTTDVVIKKRLPFLKAEWQQYVKNKSELPAKVVDFIEESLRRFDLKKFIR